MMLAALMLVASQWQTFSSRLPDFQSFFNWHSIVYFWCSLAIIKIIHEFGHGLTAKHYGGEVHEMGMLFLVLTPALYCDVTDSWLLPSKWKRIWISAAGIYVECFLASLATFVWWNTEQGLLNSLSLATMFICSVNTIMFNANPLLRYDGYYVMSDYLEIPNLRVKSTQFFAYLFQEKVLGLEIPVQSYMPRSRRTLFVTYAIASYLYRWFVTFSILYFLSQFLKPYKLQSISYMMAGGSLVPLLFMPLYQGVKFIRQPGRMRKVKKATRGGLCRGDRRVGHRNSPDPDAPPGLGHPGHDRGQAHRDLRRGARSTRLAERQGWRDREGQYRAGHPLESGKVDGIRAVGRAARFLLRQGPLVRLRLGPGQPRPGAQVPQDGAAARGAPHQAQRADRVPHSQRPARRHGDRRPPSLDDRPVRQARQALRRDRRPPQARGPPDPRPDRRRP